MSVTVNKLSAWFWLLVIPVSMVAAGLLQQTTSSSTIFRLITFWYILVVPGMTIVKLLHLEQAHIEWILAIVISICLNMLLAELMVYLHAYFPEVVLSLLLIVNLLAWLALVQITFRRGIYDDHTQ